MRQVALEARSMPCISCRMETGSCSSRPPGKLRSYNFLGRPVRNMSLDVAVGEQVLPGIRRRSG